MFRFGRRDIKICAPYDVPFSALLREIVRNFGNISPDGIVAVFNGDECDNETTLDDLGRPSIIDLRLKTFTISLSFEGHESQLNIPISLPPENIPFEIYRFLHLDSMDEYKFMYRSAEITDWSIIRNSSTPRIEIEQIPHLISFRFIDQHYQLPILSTIPLRETKPELSGLIQRSINPSNILLFIENSEISDQRTLRELGLPTEFIIRLKSVPTLFKFESQEYSFPVDWNSLISTIITSIAHNFTNVDPSSLFAADQDRTFSDLGYPPIIELHHQTVFHFNSHQYCLSYPSDCPISDIRTNLSTHVGLSPNSFTLYSDGSQVDDAMTMADLDFPASLRIQLIPEPDIELCFQSLTSTLPLTFRLSLPSEITLADAEPKIKEKCHLEEREIVFEAIDRDGQQEIVDSHRHARDFAQGSSSTLIVKLAPLPAVVKPTSPPIVVERDPLPLPSLKPNEVAVPFVVSKPINRKFTFVFEKTEKMDSARAKVARELDVEIEKIVLLFCGKVYTDNMLIGWLQLGPYPITVYVKQEVKVLVISERRHFTE
jgi:hypothetical protein